jgi:hypothetical protein
MQSFGSPEMNRWLHWNDTLIHLWLWQGDKIWTDLGLTFETTFGRSIGAGFANPFTTGPLSFPTPGTLVPVDCFDILLLQPHCAAADSCPKRPEINTPNPAAHGLWPKIHLKFDTVSAKDVLGDVGRQKSLPPTLPRPRSTSRPFEDGLSFRPIVGQEVSLVDVGPSDLLWIPHRTIHEASDNSVCQSVHVLWTLCGMTSDTVW